MKFRPLIPFALCFLLLAAAGVGAAAPPSYRLDYVVRFLPQQGEAAVTLRVVPGDGRVQRLRLDPDEARHHGFEGDGRIQHEDGKVVWRPGKGEAELRYRYRIDRPRGDGAFDARITDDWTLLRADRLIPPIAALAPDGAVSKATLSIELPEGWTYAETAYVREGGGQRFAIDNPGRRFQRPLGWMIAGGIGTRAEQVGDSWVSVAAPRGSSLRRNDILAFVNASATELAHVFGPLPPKLLIVGADDPMWRGGLSGPRSLYLHAERPLISENGSSTLMHELVHVVSGIRGGLRDDWIAEGVADYYGIELLRRGGLLSQARAEKAIEWMRNHGRSVKTLHSGRSSGPRTARAVALLADLDAEIRAETDGRRSLDDVVRPLVGDGRIDVRAFRESARRALGRPARTLETPLLD